MQLLGRRGLSADPGRSGWSVLLCSLKSAQPGSRRLPGRIAPQGGASGCLVCTGATPALEAPLPSLAHLRGDPAGDGFPLASTGVLLSPPRDGEWAGLLVSWPRCIGVNGDSQGLTTSERCSVLPCMGSGMIFLNGSQSARLVLLGGSGSSPLRASHQTAVSEKAPPSLGCSLLFQPLLISTYRAAEREEAAPHVNSLVAG